MKMSKPVRTTQIVRSMMRAHGANKHMIWTNKYKHCSTVKCYATQIKDVEALKQDLITKFVELGICNYDAYFAPSNYVYRLLDSLIVSIPKSKLELT